MHSRNFQALAHIFHCPLCTETLDFGEKTRCQDCESISDLIGKAEKGLFARTLIDQLPFKSKVLEVECGTGQLSNYLSLAQRDHFGIDMPLNSLKPANEFKEEQELDNVGFYQMNLDRPALREESFDVVLCNGVLCAAVDTDGGFKPISKLVKLGGYVLLGLYNTYGRLIKNFRSHPPRTSLDHFIVQTQLAFQGSFEGGFFTMIGRRL